MEINRKCNSFLTNLFILTHTTCKTYGDFPFCLFQVSWVRHRDVSLIAVGKFVYISDNRFRVLHESNSNDWLLTIKSVTYKDQGVYECQVTSDPYTSFKYILRVVGKIILMLFALILLRWYCFTSPYNQNTSMSL